MTTDTDTTTAARTITWVILSDVTEERGTVERVLGPGRPSDADIDHAYGTRDEVEVGARVWAGQFIAW